jgi:hypothetical protein
MTIAALIVAALFAIYSLVRAEFDKYELRKEIAELNKERDELIERVLKLGRREIPISSAGEAHELIRGQGSPLVQRGRPGRFRSFGAEKRRLESQEPPQRSVNQ